LQEIPGRGPGAAWLRPGGGNERRDVAGPAGLTRFTRAGGAFRAGVFRSRRCTLGHVLLSERTFWEKLTVRTCGTTRWGIESSVTGNPRAMTWC